MSQRTIKVDLLYLLIKGHTHTMELIVQPVVPRLHWYLTVPDISARARSADCRLCRFLYSYQVFVMKLFHFQQPPTASLILRLTSSRCQSTPVSTPISSTTHNVTRHITCYSLEEPRRHVRPHVGLTGGWQWGSNVAKNVYSTLALYLWNRKIDWISRK